MFWVTRQSGEASKNMFWKAQHIPLAGFCCDHGNLIMGIIKGISWQKRLHINRKVK
jgi:hypothetical protein